jgi:diaminohydroxyphosphoribosylaminopyrimidine deaminase/5-amino-6-(5-phosphoribosylamino)uracil reductase
VNDPGPMRRALALAAGRRTHPNPTVGCVVLDAEGTVVGEGWHEGPGTDHAEVVALAEAGERARGGTAVVTLEPCAHVGRTPPCAEALVAAGVASVVYAAGDPDPRVAGRGAAILEDAGVTVVAGLLGDEAEALDPGYFHHRRTGRARVTLKLAATLDGSTAAVDGSSRWITGPLAREDVHRLRASVDAVVVGAGTVRADTPRLDVRLAGHTGPQPTPVVVAGREPLPASDLADRAVVLATEDHPGWSTTIVEGDGLPAPAAAAAALADAGLLDVVLEGGATLAGAWWRAGVVDRVVLYLGALVGGGAGLPVLAGPFATFDDARPVTITDVRRLGPDVRITYEPA